MSRIGKQPIEVPSGVTVEITASDIKVKGSKGELSRVVHPRIKVEQEGTTLLVKRQSDSKEDKSLHGLFRSLIANMVEGVSKGYEKKQILVIMNNQKLPQNPDFVVNNNQLIQEFKNQIMLIWNKIKKIKKQNK